MKESENWIERKTGLTLKQKEFCRRMWAEYLGGEAECIFPKFVSLEFEGVYDDCRARPVELHHIVPQGYSKRVLNTNPDVPWNVAPICPEHHRIGQPGKPLTRAMQECIHIDAAAAKKAYRGTTKPTSFDRLMEQRKRITARGEKYWYDLWDEYLQLMAMEAYQAYAYNHPEDEWPVRSY